LKNFVDIYTITVSIASREEEIRRKWINFSIEEDKEAEKEEELLKLREKFKEKRGKRKTLSEYS
jgi:hypothetical protein